jgi:hypothetical protein
MPRTWQGAPNGYIDLDEDDFDQNKRPWLHKMQEDVLKPISWIQSVVSMRFCPYRLYILIRVQQGIAENVY